MKGFEMVWRFSNWGYAGMVIGFAGMVIGFASMVIGFASMSF